MPTEIPQHLALRARSFESSTVGLAAFVRFDDFAVCDVNGDGSTDIVAFSSRLRTGYVYTGFGNGQFTEGTVVDLPNRPAAVAVSMAGGTNAAQVFLVGPDGAPLLLNALVSPTASAPAGVGKFAVYSVENRSGTCLAVCDCAGSSCVLYSVQSGAVKRLESVPMQNSRSSEEWYSALTAWGAAEAHKAFPIPPAGRDRTTVIEDLDGDGNDDLVSFEAGRISVTYMGTQAKTVQFECSPVPDVIRVGDVNADGVVDILALTTSTATLQVFLGQP